MNIFVLDLDPVVAARSQCDRHVVKMPLESAQMLSTVARQVGLDVGYRSTHARHPCTLWAGDSRQSFDWLVEHGRALCIEYTHRYGHQHACEAVINGLPLGDIRHRLADVPMPAFAQAMPEVYRGRDAVEAYRRYYRGDKAGFATWRHRQPPAWWSLDDRSMTC